MTACQLRACATEEAPVTPVAEAQWLEINRAAWLHSHSVACMESCLLLFAVPVCCIETPAPRSDTAAGHSRILGETQAHAVHIDSLGE